MKKLIAIPTFDKNGILDGAAIPYVEKNHPSVDIKVIYKWIREKLGIDHNHRSIKSIYKEEKINQNRYSPRYIAELLPEKGRNGKAFFHFSNMSDYITLSSNGQLNVRGGEEDLFRAWGNSEFRNLTPHSVFQELEKEIVKINIPVLGRDYSFNSYSEFVGWLTYQGDKKLSSTFKS
jgi:hypothetical protein